MHRPNTLRTALALCAAATLPLAAAPANATATRTVNGSSEDGGLGHGPSGKGTMRVDWTGSGYVSPTIQVNVTDDWANNHAAAAIVFWTRRDNSNWFERVITAGRKGATASRTLRPTQDRTLTEVTMVGVKWCRWNAVKGYAPHCGAEHKIFF